MKRILLLIALSFTACICPPPTSGQVEQGADTLAADLVERPIIPEALFGELRAELERKLGPACNLIKFAAEHLLAVLPLVASNGPPPCPKCQRHHAVIPVHHRAFLEYLAGTRVQR